VNPKKAAFRIICHKKKKLKIILSRHQGLEVIIEV
jgi:hypothetical protein